MSHFSVLVIGDDIERQLEPYQENNMEDCPQEYLEFSDEEEGYLKSYNEESVEMWICGEKKLYSWDDKFKISEGFCSVRLTDEQKEELGYKKEEILHKDRYETFEEYMSDYCGEEDRDEKMGKYGYWSNPNTQWDWYVIGGRWAGSLKLKEGKKGEIGDTSTFERVHKEAMDEYTKKMSSGKFVDSAIKGDVDFSRDEEKYKEALRFWEIVVEEKPLKEGEEKPFTLSKKEYFIEKYKDKETYARLESEFSTFAVLKDGEWFEKGDMGWFGCHSASPEEERKWDENFYDKFIKDLPDETKLTIVDCHI